MKSIPAPAHFTAWLSRFRVYVRALVDAQRNVLSSTPRTQLLVDLTPKGHCPGRRSVGPHRLVREIHAYHAHRHLKDERTMLRRAYEFFLPARLKLHQWCHADSHSAWLRGSSDRRLPFLLKGRHSRLPLGTGFGFANSNQNGPVFVAPAVPVVLMVGDEVLVPTVAPSGDALPAAKAAVHRTGATRRPSCTCRSGAA
jgi:hypothetical protein